MLNESLEQRAWRWLAVAGISVATMAVQAAEPASTSNGLMTFPNVKVVAEPVAASNARAGQAPASQGAFRAFIDSDTGKLRRPTAQEAATLEAAEHDRLARGKGRLRSTTQPTLIYPAKGGVGMALDESQMAHSVARKDADGKLIEECLPDAKEAQLFLRTKPTSRSLSAAKGDLK